MYVTVCIEINVGTDRFVLAQQILIVFHKRIDEVLESTRARLDKLGKNIVPSFYFFPSPFVPGSLEYINK